MAGEQKETAMAEDLLKKLGARLVRLMKGSRSGILAEKKLHDADEIEQALGADSEADSTDSEMIRSMRSQTVTRQLAEKLRASVNEVSARYNLPNNQAKKLSSLKSSTRRPSKAINKFFDDEQGEPGVVDNDDLALVANGPSSSSRPKYQIKAGSLTSSDSDADEDLNEDEWLIYTIKEISDESCSGDGAEQINKTDKKIVSLMKDTERKKMNVEGVFLEDSRSSWISNVSRSENSDSSELNMDAYKVRQDHQM